MIGLVDMGIVIEPEPGYYALNPDVTLVTLNDKNDGLRILASVNGKTYIIEGVAAKIVDYLRKL